jgi:hypothetical protein
VPGKPHLFVLPDGRMSYEPPTPQGAVTPRPKRVGYGLSIGKAHAVHNLQKPPAASPLDEACERMLQQLDLRPGKVREMAPLTPPSRVKWDDVLGRYVYEPTPSTEHMADAARYRVFDEPVDPVKTATGGYLQAQWDAYRERQNAAARARMEAPPVAPKRAVRVYRHED